MLCIDYLQGYYFDEEILDNMLLRFTLIIIGALLPNVYQFTYNDPFHTHSSPVQKLEHICRVIGES